VGAELFLADGQTDGQTGRQDEANSLKTKKENILIWF
jgi:hypothetical protein